jgi:hypothetical protein
LGRTLYLAGINPNDDPVVGMMDSPELAAYIVEAVVERDRLRQEIKALRAAAVAEIVAAVREQFGDEDPGQDHTAFIERRFATEDSTKESAWRLLAWLRPHTRYWTVGDERPAPDATLRSAAEDFYERHYSAPERGRAKCQKCRGNKLLIRPRWPFIGQERSETVTCDRCGGTGDEATVPSVEKPQKQSTAPVEKGQPVSDLISHPLREDGAYRELAVLAQDFAQRCANIAPLIDGYDEAAWDRAVLAIRHARESSGVDASKHDGAA